jgi:hypothetical protein
MLFTQTTTHRYFLKCIQPAPSELLEIKGHTEILVENKLRDLQIGRNKLWAVPAILGLRRTA